MSVTTVEQREEWTALTDRLGADHRGHDVTIEIPDAAGGGDPTVERLPFDSIIFDPRADMVIVSVGGRSPRYPVVLRHLIGHPREMLVDPTGRGAALRITDASGTTTLVSLLRRGRPA
jgi:hypothetical protein